MTKKLPVVLAMALLASVQADAANLLQGTRELGIGGLVDLDTWDGTEIAIEASYGYFWADFVESGIRVGLGDSNSVTTWHIGLFSEYNFFRGHSVVPYLGASVDLLGADLDLPGGTSDETAAGIGLDAGVKVFMTEAIAITTQLGVDMASAEVFPAEDGAEDVNWDLTLGIRFFF